MTIENARARGRQCKVQAALTEDISGCEMSFREMSWLPAFLHSSTNVSRTDWLKQKHSIVLFVRWDHRQITQLLCFSFPTNTIGEMPSLAQDHCENLRNILSYKSLVQSNEDVTITAIVSVIEYLLRTKCSSKCVT